MDLNYTFILAKDCRVGKSIFVALVDRRQLPPSIFLTNAFYPGGALPTVYIMFWGWGASCLLGSEAESGVNANVRCVPVYSSDTTREEVTDQVARLLAITCNCAVISRRPNLTKALTSYRPRWRSPIASGHPQEQLRVTMYA